MNIHAMAEEHHRRGQDLLRARRDAEALEHFRRAHALEPTGPRYRSSYGLGLALVERRFSEAAELCRSAVKQEFFDPELYHNLVRVYLCFGFKAEAVRYLRRGLTIDPGNAPMLEELHGLGVRQPPVLGFLARSHPLNRWLGRLRRRLARLRPAPAARSA